MNEQELVGLAKRRLNNITFEHQGAHVALVSKEQGGAANGYNTLVTKGVDVKAFATELTELMNQYAGEQEQRVQEIVKAYEDVNPTLEPQPETDVERTTRILMAKYSK
nr:hypothetical protein [uncultured Pseudomonas sp.]